MKFTKMQGIGNDYVYIDCFKERVSDPSAAAVKLSDRHFGVGSDGLILICPSDRADCRMDMYNADGSRGAMCGNGIRCVGKYVYDHGIVNKTSISVETLAGIRQLELHAEGGKVTSVTVDMGRPVLTSGIGEPIEAAGRRWHFTGISMGNPHAVIFGGDPAKLAISEIGPEFESHPRFPDRVNTEFVKVLDRGHMKMRVWERGSGETLACGTGACACLAAAVLNGLTDRRARVELLGGALDILWDGEQDRIFMTGPAEEVFRGEIDL